MPGSPDRPVVSVILPTYNRAKFLPQAFASIQSQTFADWELIVVDDGSTDDTRETVEGLTRGWRQPVRYHRQENRGAYGARNAGLDLAAGRYIAFFDSDDVWLPHHLAHGVAGLDAHPDVDWVYGACRIIDLDSGRVDAESSFHDVDGPRPFLQLGARAVDQLRIIEDPKLFECAILCGLYCGLQNSVIRACVFDGYRFPANRRNEAEDQLVVIHALAKGRRFAYFDDVHVIYHIHGGNSSAAGAASTDKRVRLYTALVEGYEDLRDQMRLTRAQRRAFDRRLGGEYFWNIGYQMFKHGGRAAEGLAMMRKGLRIWPTSLRLWKTYLFARVGLDRAWHDRDCPCA